MKNTLRIPLLCIACVLMLKLDVSSLHRGLYSVSLSTKEDNQHKLDRSKNENKKNKHQLSVKDRLHSTHEEIVDLLEWEKASLEAFSHPNVTQKTLQQTCQPPPGVSKTCCLGSFSAGGGVTDQFRYQCIPSLRSSGNKNETSAMDSLRQHTQEFFRDNPVAEHHDQKCDACRIVDLARRHNLTIAFMGDSIHSQVMDGLICELERRSYQVTVEKVDHNPNKETSYPYRRHSVSFNYRIHSPTWGNSTFLPQVVTIQFHMMYLLPLIHSDAISNITAQADVVVLGFGLHWWYDNASPFVLKRRDNYLSQMKELFGNITQQGHVRLLLHRETSAQHFDADGGDFSLWYDYRDKLSNECQPLNSHSSTLLWREQAIEKAALDSGTNLIVAGPNMPPLTPRSNNNKTANEVVVLPYLNFTSPHHGLHPHQEGQQDCTHFCSSPFMYYPLWRSLRFAFDRQFG